MLPTQLDFKVGSETIQQKLHDTKTKRTGASAASEYKLIRKLLQQKPNKSNTPVSLLEKPNQ